MQNFPWLTALAATPLLAALLVWWVRPVRRVAQGVALAVSVVLLGGAVAMASAFDLQDAGTHQFVETRPWIPALGASYAVGVDGLGLLMVLLTAFLVPIVLLSSWRHPAGGPAKAAATPHGRAEHSRRQAGYVALVLALEALTIALFAARDLFLFYVLFEAILVPVYFLIGAYGGARRRAAAVKFLLFGLTGGLVMLAAVIGLYVAGPGGAEGFLVESLTGLELGVVQERWLFLGMFFAFAVKAPLWPVHTWLPDAAQQGTPGTSTLLVGVLDKVGTFGMIALVLPFFPRASAWAAPVVIALALVSIIYGGLLAIGQSDLMRLVAYTSVSHFGFIILGVFAFTGTAITGAGLYMVAHGLSTAGLFLVGGMLTARAGTQDLARYGGMQRVTPVLAGTFLVAGLASIALPGLSGFAPEFLVLVGSYARSTTAGVVATAGVIIAALYVLIAYQRVFTGPPRDDLVGTRDLGARERWLVAPLVAAMLALGLYPAPAVEVLEPVARETVAAVGVSDPTAQPATAAAAGPADDGAGPADDGVGEAAAVGGADDGAGQAEAAGPGTSTDEEVAP